ncbi:uncharacterized protein LY89DRAFT_84513 [Mollisia scopiformis]|uniref:Rhodopsin domain-containing protein n=1 Tax=Mollisia scopiformis TaxID=149040 RepID=A0A194X8P9_MOLSC|nr:uncharacterized protein LY89DRAFT_84513 [Mollisia scopiformis]KUJ16489.1 hypothetical protein LY89DRAFT_84513 [Mollisia scopiformis]
MAYDLHANKGPHVLGIVIAFPILAAFCLSLRLYTRFKIIHNAALEDYCSVVGLIFSIATSVCMGYQVKNGMGRHMQTLTPQDGVNSVKFLFASILTYNISLLFIKLSILLQYLRICISPRVRLFCHLTLILIISYGIETFFTGLLTCLPVSYFWDKTIPGGKCVNEPALWFANAGINIFQDLCLLVLPFFILRELILGKRQKAGLMLVLSLGAFACIASICRLHALYEVSVSKDMTWDNPGTAIWSSIELNTAIICTSISVLKPLVSRLLPGMLSSRKSSEAPKIRSGGNGTVLSFSAGKWMDTTLASSEDGKFEMMDESEREVWGLREVRESVGREAESRQGLRDGVGPMSVEV